MARWRIVENGMRSLVLSLCGSEIGDENIQLCLDFSMQQLRHHNFLDTNEKKVDEMINGICDKLVIHNLQSKADLLKEYCQLFLCGPISEDNIQENTTLHYSLLHLLLLISYSPTEDKTAYCKNNIFTTRKQRVDQKFDWKAYLLDGEEDYNNLGNYEESDFGDDSSDVVGSEDIGDVMFHHNISGTQESGTSENGQASLKTLSCVEDAHDSNKEIMMLQNQMVISGNWMRNHVMSPYWLKNVRDQCNNHLPNRSARLLRDWNNYLSSTSCIDLTKSQNLITEYQVVREVLWMANGLDDLFVFHWDGFKYVVNKNVVLSHLAESSLHHLLEEASSFGTMVRSLKEFYETTSNKILPGTDPPTGDSITREDLRCIFSSFVTNQTHQSFSEAVHSQLNGVILSRVAEIEKMVLKQDETITLSGLMLMLEPLFKLLSILFYFLAEGIIRLQAVQSISSSPFNPSSPSESNSFSHFQAAQFIEKTPNMFCRNLPNIPTPASSSKLALHLLNTIYGCFIMADQSAAFKDEELNLLLQIWMDTCKPYMEMLDAWLNCGSIHDPWDEFFIKRSEDWEMLGESFWERAVYLDKEENTSFIFMEPVLREVIVIGKSLHLLETITDKTKALSQTHAVKPLFLYHLYSTSLFEANEIDHKSSKVIRDGRLKNVCKDASISRFLQTFYPASQIDNMFVEMLRIKLERSDPLLLTAVLNPIQSLHYCGKDTCNDSPSSPQQQRRKEFLLHMTLQRVFHEYVHSRYLLISGRLLSVIRDECHFYLHINAIKKYFLMESGSMMFDFYTVLFQDMNAGVEWFQDGYLKFLLCRSFRGENTEELERITIVVDDLKSPLTSIHCLESISMNYKSPWPCNMIINSISMAHYSEIFQFLLQIKWAKSSLDCLRFSDLKDSKTDGSLMHKMFLFKMKILHFVNSFHNYIMTRILHSLGLEFLYKFDSSLDFDELITSHSAYIETLYNRCLLHDKVHFIRKLVLKLLQMALDISKMWTSTNICATRLNEMELDYNRCLHFLSSLVNQIAARGSLAHC